MAFARFCLAALDGKPIEIYGDGRQTRDFTFVGDVVTATQAAAVTSDIACTTMNIGGGSQISLAEVVDLLAEVSGREIDRLMLDEQRGDVRDTAADIRLAQAAIGYVPRISIRDGLAAQWRWAHGRHLSASSR